MLLKAVAESRVRASITRGRFRYTMVAEKAQVSAMATATRYECLFLAHSGAIQHMSRCRLLGGDRKWLAPGQTDSIGSKRPDTSQ